MRLVAVPVYNEQESIEAVFAEICKYHSGHILAVNDGSSDASQTILEGLAVRCPDHKLKLIHNPRNLGYGASLIKAFEYAISNAYKTLVTIDCDWQHEPIHIPEFFKEIENFDVVSGSRYLEENSANDIAPKDRLRINKIITEIICQETNYKITDAFCGFKAYRTSALARLNLTENGYAFPLQFWIQAFKNRLSLSEIPVPRIYKDQTRSFGPTLDNPERRLAYYMEVINRELGR